MFERISLKLVELVSEEDGQGATEYAMVIGFLIIGLGVGLTVLGDGILAFLQDVADSLPAVP
jgi:Flp pilus assembly pilin Flp